MKASWMIAAAIALLCGLVSCGSSGSGTVRTELQDTQLQQQLPGTELDGVDGPRAVSVQGNGTYALQLDRILQASQAAMDGDELVLSPGGDSGWALYRISGFDGDMFPLCAQVEVSQGSQPYRLAFPDYNSGRWSFSPALSGSATADIPAAQGVQHPLRSVSEFGNSYMLLLTEGTEELRISGITLEVFGGSNAPLPPSELSDSDGQTEIILSWYPSPDEDAPDFAGYLLERAPFNSGNYTELLRGPSPLNTYVDADVTPLVSYRYRLRSLDSAGNLSAAIYQFDAMCGQGTAEVVAILDMPAGDYTGPAEVEFDLSGSYVTDGSQIDNYELLIDGQPPISGPSSSYTLLLQPGCYRVTGVAHSGALSDFAISYVRVLPQWQEQSVLVDEMQGNSGSMLLARSARLPDGRLVHVGYDAGLHLINVWQETAGGLRFHSYYSGDDEIISSCEPVLDGDVLHFGFSTDGGLQIISVDSAGPQRLLQPLGLDGGIFCLALDGDGHPCLFRQIDNGGNFDLIYSRFDQAAQTQTVLSAVPGGIKAVDAVWNPSISAFDICYGDNVALLYEQWEPLGGHIAGGGLYNFKVLQVDLEADPVSQRSTMLVLLDVAPFESWYMYQESAGNWSLPEKPAPGLKCARTADLRVANGDSHVLVQLNDGIDELFRFYSRDSGNWPLNSEMLVADSADYPMSLLPLDGNGMLGCIPLKSGTHELLEFPFSGIPASQQLIGHAGDGLRGELHATAGSDGLHVVWLNEAYDELEHFRSSDGQSWADTAPGIGKVTDLDLASTSGGEVYLSFVDVNSTKLQYWDGSSWMSQLAYPGIAGFRPSLMSQPTNEVMYWYVHLQPANALRYVEGNQSTPWSYVAQNPAQPTWQGALMDGGFSFQGIKPRWFSLIGPSLVNSELHFYDYNIMDPELIGIHQNGTSQRKVYGRTMDCCLYMSTEGVRQSLWLTGASGLMDSVRMLPTPPSTELAPMVVPVRDPIAALVETGIRFRSVNMSQARGRTALALESGMLGYDSKLFWSDFGRFTQLPLPTQLDDTNGAWIMSPEVVVGMDGRWHVIYLDIPSGQMRCISTVD
ncbi:fibronectin type III domain-containing protein [bacterium]|nr:fibronectin type III domain-containing protein [bacterium]